MKIYIWLYFSCKGWSFCKGESETVRETENSKDSKDCYIDFFLPRCDSIFRDLRPLFFDEKYSTGGACGRLAPPTLGTCWPWLSWLLYTEKSDWQLCQRSIYNISLNAYKLGLLLCLALFWWLCLSQDHCASSINQRLRIQQTRDIL